MGRRKTQLCVYLDPSDLESLRTLSELTEIPMAEYIRTWIKTGLYGSSDDDWIRLAIRRLGDGLELSDRPPTDDLETSEPGSRTLVSEADDGPEDESGEANDRLDRPDPSPEALADD